MTTSCLNHTQGIRGYKYKKTERTADTEIYYLHSTAKQVGLPAVPVSGDIQRRNWTNTRHPEPLHRF
ncbi:MAG: hypothetical protein DRP64_19550 [Verrucomicrobia bacterium]|nr:MAG: hypothetical protein DRP64_19550 [Verrucomicrobiota bacterium]